MMIIHKIKTEWVARGIERAARIGVIDGIHLLESPVHGDEVPLGLYNPKTKLLTWETGLWDTEDMDEVRDTIRQFLAVCEDMLEK